MKCEADFQTRFGKWLMANKPPAGAYELKFTTTNSIPFSAVKEHQVRALLAAKNIGRGLYYKPQDYASFSKIPFDCFWLKEVGGFVVFMYYQNRGDKEFVVIDIDDFLKEIKISKRKSLIKERAYEIGTVYKLSERTSFPAKEPEVV